MLFLSIFLTIVWLFCLIRGWRQCQHRRWFSGVRHLLYAILIAAPLFMLLNGVWHLHFLQRLQQSEPVVTLSFKRISSQHFQATVVWPQGQVKTFTLVGDRWQLFAQVWVWQRWLQYLGMKNDYRLQALQSYTHWQGHGTQTIHVYPLSATPDNAFWQWGARHIIQRYFAQTIFGSAVYMPMVDQAHYQVVFEQTSLVAQPLNQVARHAVGLS